MTKLWILSDLHVDVMRYALEQGVEADVLVLAGDIGGKLEGQVRLWLERHLPRDIPVVLVPGNHDFYGSDLAKSARRFLRKTSLTNVHLLDAGQSVVIGGTRFVGATLWTDYELTDDAWRAQNTALEYLTDFRRIHHRQQWASPASFAGIHDLHRAAIESVLSTLHDGPTVVVTHHAPSRRSLSPRIKRGHLDAAYASDLEDLILRHAPDVWIHGHVHVPQDYWIGPTRILANPRGYYERKGGFGKHGWWEHENPAFDGRLVVEVRRRPEYTGATIEHALESPEDFGLPASAGRLWTDEEDEKELSGGWKP